MLHEIRCCWRERRCNYVAKELPGHQMIFLVSKNIITVAAYLKWQVISKTFLRGELVRSGPWHRRCCTWHHLNYRYTVTFSCSWRMSASKRNWCLRQPAAEPFFRCSRLLIGDEGGNACMWRAEMGDMQIFVHAYVVNNNFRVMPWWLVIISKWVLHCWGNHIWPYLILLWPDKILDRNLWFLKLLGVGRGS